MQLEVSIRYEHRRFSLLPNEPNVQNSPQVIMRGLREYQAGELNFCISITTAHYSDPPLAPNPFSPESFHWLKTNLANIGDAIAIGTHPK